jgi:prevent-host-death family protein
MAEMTETAPDVLSFSALGEALQQLVEQVQATKSPVVIAKDGRAAVLVEAQEYELHLRKLALMERIMRGKREIAEGHFYTQEEVESLLDERSGEGALSLENEDAESLSLSANPQFLEIIEQSRERLAAEGGTSSEEMRRRIGLERRTRKGKSS